jgi:DJ-1 family protein
MSRRALVLFAEGFEEIETVTIIDVLRRAEIEVTTAAPTQSQSSTGGGESGFAGTLPVTGAHGIAILPDTQMAAVRATDFDAVVLPGGMPNATSLAESEEAQRIIQAASGADRVLGAICAAPIALHAAGALEGRNVTSHPSVAAQLEGAKYRTDRVVTDGKLITSRGPGTALEFALALVAVLVSPGRAEELAGPMLVARL